MAVITILVAALSTERTIQAAVAVRASHSSSGLALSWAGRVARAGADPALRNAPAADTRGQHTGAAAAARRSHGRAARGWRCRDQRASSACAQGPPPHRAGSVLRRHAHDGTSSCHRESWLCVCTSASHLPGVHSTSFEWLVTSSQREAGAEEFYPGDTKRIPNTLSSA